MECVWILDQKIGVFSMNIWKRHGRVNFQKKAESSGRRTRLFDYYTFLLMFSVKNVITVRLLLYPGII